VGLGLFQNLPGSETLSRRSLPAILARIQAAEDAQRADPWLSEGRTWTDVLQTCMQHTVADLSEHCGSDPKSWKYGRWHTLNLRHVLGKIPMLSPIFNRGHWPTGGDLDTVCTGYTPRDALDPTYVGALYRQICDTGDWDASVSVLMGGQSGHPASRHYCDLTPLWLRGEYHPMLWSRAKVEQYTTATLLLEPETE
jgi:penicillin amidase